MQHIHFKNWIAKHKAVVHWFHNAHVNVGGTSFAGDHVNLYGSIYEGLDEITDGIIERGIGLTGDASIGDPAIYLASALTHLNGYNKVTNLKSREIAQEACSVLRDYLSFLTGMFKSLEDIGALSLGLDDMISSLANAIEEYLYLLQQRTLVKENKMNNKQRLRKIIRKTLNEGHWHPTVLWEIVSDAVEDAQKKGFTEEQIRREFEHAMRSAFRNNR